MRSPVLVSFLALFLATSLTAQEAPSAAESTAEEMARLFQALGSRVERPKVESPKAETPSLEGEPTGGRELSVLAYSYCLRGRTASGRYTKHGIVAVDPRVIPLGSKLYVPGYGWAIAADTGGAIIGNKIDVWLPSAAECYQWGVRRITIKVFER